jgi:hypothetical protein
MPPAPPIGIGVVPAAPIMPAAPMPAAPMPAFGGVMGGFTGGFMGGFVFVPAEPLCTGGALVPPRPPLLPRGAPLPDTPLTMNPGPTGVSVLAQPTTNDKTIAERTTLRMSNPPKTLPDPAWPSAASGSPTGDLSSSFPDE